jgi:hypothetical protein
MAQFILLIKGGYETDKEFTPEEQQAAIQRYREWANSLIERNRLVDAAKLADKTGKHLVKRDGQIVVDAPFAETKETIGGFYIVEADSMQMAIGLAQECPIFDEDGTIEIRQIEN